MERYKKLFNLENDLYHEGSGVIIEAGALLLDTKTDSTVAQLKFKNITSKRIKGIQISLNCFDIGGKELQGIDEFQYLDLDILPNQEFGSKTPINLPVANTRSFSIKDCTIYYEDTTQCKLGSVWESLKKAKVKNGSVEFKKQYKIEFGENAQYEYDKYKDLWYCACGSINREENITCVCCRVKREKLELLDDEQMESHMQERLTYEDKITKEKKEKEDKENTIKSKKKKKHTIIAISVSLLLVSFFMIAYFVWGIPYGNYKDACALLEEDRYDEAYNAFIGLEDYKDSDVMAMECIYQKATEFLNDKEYDLAVTEYSKIIEYKDSETMLLEIKYQRAMDNFNNERYSQALSIFKELDDYKNSEDLVLECMYQHVLVNDPYLDYEVEYYNILLDANYKDIHSMYNNLPWYVLDNF